MNKIIKKINSNIGEVYLVYIIFGLSISILLKDINLTFFQFSFFETIYFYRIILIFFTLYLFFSFPRKFNLNILLLSLISILFLFNSLYGETIVLENNQNYLINKFNIDPNSFFYNEKFKSLIINLFNIFFPLCVLMFIKLSINFNNFYKISYAFCELFLIVLSIFVTIKLFQLHFKPDQENFYFGIESDFPKNFINPHGLLYILNIYFIQNIIEIYKKKNLKKNLIYIFLIITLFLISGSVIFLGLCFITFLILTLNKSKKLFIYLLPIVFISLFLIIYYILYQSNQDIPGSLYNSIALRIAYIKLFLLDTIDLNYIYGSNIFSKNIYTYPHNFLIDIFICSGFFGLFLIGLLLVKINKIFKNKNLYFSNFVFLIFFQLLLFSLLSGFFFVNIELNILCAIILNLSNFKDEKIT